MSVTIDRHSLILLVFRSSAIFDRLFEGAQHTLQVFGVGWSSCLTHVVATT
jgi:hypothetical protein